MIFLAILLLCFSTTTCCNNGMSFCYTLTHTHFYVLTNHGGPTSFVKIKTLSNWSFLNLKNHGRTHVGHRAFRTMTRCNHDNDLVVNNGKKKKNKASVSEEMLA